MLTLNVRSKCRRAGVIFRTSPAAKRKAADRARAHNSRLSFESCVTCLGAKHNSCLQAFHACDEQQGGAVSVACFTSALGRRTPAHVPGIPLGKQERVRRRFHVRVLSADNGKVHVHVRGRRLDDDFEVAEGRRGGAEDLRDGRDGWSNSLRPRRMHAGRAIWPVRWLL